MKRAPLHRPTEADLRAAHAESSLRRFPFERAMADTAMSICIRVAAEIRARRVPAAPQDFELTP